MSSTYRVAGMTCDGCVRAVTRAIRRAAPGASVAVDLEEGTITVDGEAPVPVVARAVEDAGFRFDGRG